MYGAEKGSKLFQSMNDKLFQLFKEYKNKCQPNNDTLGDSSLSNSNSKVTYCEIISKMYVSILKARFVHHI